MQKFLIVFAVSCGFILGGTTLWAQTTASSAPATTTATTSATKVMHKPRQERHPQIRIALHKLREAKQHLEQASHDYGGHRAKAIEDINHAIAELQEALQFDKK